MAMKYEQQIDNEAGMVGEAAVAYGATARQRPVLVDSVSEKSDAEDLPSDILRMALECVREDKKRGKLIPGDQIDGIISKEMGWI